MNIVLIGLSGSGKTTLSKEVGRRLGMRVVDMDDMVEEEAGMSIGEIFKRYGEKHFRDLETRAAKRAAALRQTVVATGGGAVTRAENMVALRESGVVVFLDRPPEAIVQDVECAGRPLLANGPEKLFAMSWERRPMYLAAADLVFQNGGTLAQAVRNLTRLIRDTVAAGLAGPQRRSAAVGIGGTGDYLPMRYASRGRTNGVEGLASHPNEEETIMILVLKPGGDPGQVAMLERELKDQGLELRGIKGESKEVIGLVGDTSALSEESFTRYECVERVIKVQEPYKLAGRRFHPQDTVVDVMGRKIGGGEFAVMAGPCSVESGEQILSIAKSVRLSGAAFLRGGAFKPRTSPYAFQGLGLDGLELLKAAREKTGLPIVTEIMSAEYVEVFAQEVDVIQVGARNMQNFQLLREVGRTGRPVLLKRGLSSTVEELLMAAEYVLSGGKSQVILCERGIRTFETSTRNTLDLSAIPVLKEKSHLPVIVDPSHGTGYWHLVYPMALAAVAAGADGLIIEVHNHPERALCDGPQSITPELFDKLMKKIAQLRAALTAA